MAQLKFLGGIFALSIGLSACSGGGQSQAAPPAPEVTVATPLVQQILDWDDYVGRFEAVEDVEVKPRVSGYLVGVHFRDGQYVRQGQLLFTIDARPAQAKADIVDTAVAAGQFKTLAAALTAAGLVDTLKGEGPFTVFAPTDAAFAALPAGTVDNLLKPENKQKLTEILTYHVVAGKVMAADVAGIDEAKSVNGKMIDIEVEGSAVKVNDATVTTADIAASNGVIHVIDKVIMPPEG